MGGVLRVTERKEVQQIRHGVHLKVSTLLNTLEGDFFFFFFSFNGDGKGTLKMYAKHITTILTAEGKKSNSCVMIMNVITATLKDKNGQICHDANVK